MTTLTPTDKALGTSLPASQRDAARDASRKGFQTRRLACAFGLLLALFAGACGQPDATPPPPDDAPPQNIVYLYARLHESQQKDTAEQQYLPNLKKALADREADIQIEEIRGAEGTVEFIGVDFRIAAPESETEALETLLMDTFRLSGAPYATQILIYSP